MEPDSHIDFVRPPLGRRLVLFAHTPPPNHGQSYMVQLLLDGLGGDARRGDVQPKTGPGSQGVSGVGVDRLGTKVYHVNARFSGEAADIGRFQITKLLRLPLYCLEAVYCRLRFRADTLFYVPAPAKRVALYRDWLVMLCCRPFFREVVFHWHASGLGAWLNREATGWERWLTRRLMGRPDLSVILGNAAEPDAVALSSKRVCVVANGIPDPCGDYASGLQQERECRREERELAVQQSSGAEEQTEVLIPLLRVLFLSLCTRDKGLFEVVEAVEQLQRRMTERSVNIRIQLVVAGSFPNPRELEEFERILLSHRNTEVASSRTTSSSRLAGETVPLVRYEGFADGHKKEALFRQCDVFCFPTYYQAESFPLVLLEAMAYGMEIVATRWRNIPELLPQGYPGLVPTQSPQEVVDALDRSLTANTGPALRRRFQERFTIAKHVASVVEALETLAVR